MCIQYLSNKLSSFKFPSLYFTINKMGNTVLCGSEYYILEYPEPCLQPDR